MTQRGFVGQKMLIKYKKQLKGVIIGLIISLIIAFVPFRMQRIIELKTLDFRIAHRHDIPVSSDIVVICIDNETIKKNREMGNISGLLWIIALSPFGYWS